LFDFYLIQLNVRGWYNAGSVLGYMAWASYCTIGQGLKELQIRLQLQKFCGPVYRLIDPPYHYIGMQSPTAHALIK